MPRFIASIGSLFFAAVLLTLVSGCERPVPSCSEFDPPPGKEPSSCPPKAAAAVQAQPALPARYCYSSLAQVDCFTEPQPGRPGYMGSTEAPAPTEASSKADKPAAAKAMAAKPAPVPTAQPAADQAPSSPPPAPAATAAPTPLKPASAN